MYQNYLADEKLWVAYASRGCKKSSARFSSLMNAFISGVSTKLLLMPFVDLTLRPQPVGQIMTMLAAALLPQLLGALCDLFFQTHAFVHAQNGSGIFVNGFLFHKSPSLVWSSFMDRISCAKSAG